LSGGNGPSAFARLSPTYRYAQYCGVRRPQRINVSLINFIDYVVRYSDSRARFHLYAGKSRPRDYGKVVFLDQRAADAAGVQGSDLF